MKIFNKRFIEYFNSAKHFMLLIFLLSIIQVILILLGYFHGFELVQISQTAGILKADYFNSITIIGLLELILVVIVGFYLVLKKNFKLRNNLIVSVFLFVSSLLLFLFIPSILPQMPMALKILNSLVILILNLLLFMTASLLGGILSLIYKRFT
jgi:hypothetical protein